MTLCCVLLDKDRLGCGISEDVGKEAVKVTGVATAPDEPSKTIEAQTSKPARFGRFQTEARRAIGSIVLVPRYAGWDTIIPSLLRAGQFAVLPV